MTLTCDFSTQPVLYGMLFWPSASVLTASNHVKPSSTWLPPAARGGTGVGFEGAAASGVTAAGAVGTFRAGCSSPGLRPRNLLLCPAALELSRASARKQRQAVRAEFFILFPFTPSSRLWDLFRAGRHVRPASILLAAPRIKGVVVGRTFGEESCAELRRARAEFGLINYRRRGRV
jgi:hypothetical protein